jgi:micrococcal nuclease
MTTRPTAQPPIRLLLALLALDASTASAQSDSAPVSPRRPTVPCTVTRISDGDTIECAGKVRVRLIGVDSPERDQEPFGTAAKAGLAAMLIVGSVVQLEPDVEARDRYDRVLAYVWYQGRMINWLLVRDGWAVPLVFPPNVRYAEYFSAARDQARKDGRGLWSVDGFRCEPAAHRARRC